VVFVIPLVVSRRRAAKASSSSRSLKKAASVDVDVPTTADAISRKPAVISSKPLTPK
jgi:hypothetical protein